MSRYIKLAFCLLFFASSFGQVAPAQTGENWDLRKCVDYALKNNITIKQADLQIRFAKMDLHQSKLAQYPFANLNGNIAYSSGRNQDPTTFSLITTGYLSSSYSLQTSVNLFNWFTHKK